MLKNEQTSKVGIKSSDSQQHSPTTTGSKYCLQHDLTCNRPASAAVRRFDYKSPSSPDIRRALRLSLSFRNL
jgi:hypothetical protein